MGSSSLPALASVAAVETRMGVPIGSVTGIDLLRLQENLADASTMVRLRTGRTWVGPDGQVSAPDAVVMITALAAKRAFENPDSYTSESIGGAYTYQRDQTAVTVYLTEAEGEILEEATRAAARQAGGWTGTGTVRTPSTWVRDDPIYHRPWAWGP